MGTFARMKEFPRLDARHGSRDMDSGSCPESLDSPSSLAIYMRQFHGQIPNSAPLSKVW